MANLKALSVRIKSVTSTRKITSAMKMIAAARLKKAQQALEGVKAYAETLELAMHKVARHCEDNGIALPATVVGRKSPKTALLVVLTSDRGLCGGFNNAVIKMAESKIAEAAAEGKTCRLLCLGNKGRDVLKRRHPEMMTDLPPVSASIHRPFRRMDAVGLFLHDRFNRGEIDEATLLFNRYKSTISQVPDEESLVPLLPKDFDDLALATDDGRADFDYEPDPARLIDKLAANYFSMKLFRASLNSAAAEHGARMTSMDAATRNAGDIIDGLTLRYNRTRQAIITTELTEIISGSEALK